MGTRIDPDGTGLEWFALDRDGHLGFFTSQGSRVVPERVLESEEEWERLRRKAATMPPVGKGSRAWFVSGNLDLWIRMAERGFFSFILESCNHRVSEEGHYRRVAKPSRPLLAQSLDEDLRRALARVSLNAICFAKTRILEGDLIRSVE
jgi:hypothetical protein